MDMSAKTLDLLPEGSTAQVLELLPTSKIRRRLLDLGLIAGTKVKCLQKSPAGDPAAYLIRGAVIALRCEDSAQIRIVC